MGTLDDWDELGPPELRPVPQGHQTARRTAVAIAVIVGGLVLVGFGVWMAAGGMGEPAKPARVPDATSSVTESFTVSTAPTSSPGTDTTTTPGSSAGTEAPVITPGGYSRAPRVAFRKEDGVWVASESGAGARRISDSTSGPFALSPDGTKLAVVDERAKMLAVVDVESARVTTVGPAEVQAPVWSPSSEWLGYVVAGKVNRVERDGTGERFLGSGHLVAIGPDDVSYAFAGDGAIFLSVKGATVKRLATKGGAIDAVAVGTDRVYYALGGASPTSVSLHAMSLSGSDDRTLAGPPKESGAGGYDSLELSPDGSLLAYQVVGDTKYSRLRCMSASGSSDRAISMRRDGYFLRWTADGKRLMFIDGNVLQGDTTQLMSVRPDGTGRATIVRDAGI